MKNSRMTILITTMTALAAALSFVPRTSRTVIARTMKTAGRLNTPPSEGDVLIAAGNS